MKEAGPPWFVRATSFAVAATISWLQLASARVGYTKFHSRSSYVVLLCRRIRLDAGLVDGLSGF